MRKVLRVVGKGGQRVIDLADQQILAVIQARDWLVHRVTLPRFHALSDSLPNLCVSPNKEGLREGGCRNHGPLLTMRTYVRKVYTKQPIHVTEDEFASREAVCLSYPTL